MWQNTKKKKKKKLKDSENILVCPPIYFILFYRDAYIVSIGDAITSIFAGLVIFAILGFMANELSTTVDKVADEGRANHKIYSKTIPRNVFV